jgi:hypothetical protein
MERLILPPVALSRITQELETLPSLHGKISLTIEFNCGPSKTFHSMKVKRYTEDEVRP